MLNAFQIQLYQRLQEFKLDDPTHEFGFTRHLMKNQGWTLTYAERAIAEYKKFAFLTVVANHQVVPSDQVDQVWHAHVLLTQSYWEEFCPKVLGKKLHHHPARGGRAERAEFHHLYAQTIASYQLFFGAPPTDIWSPADVRFGSELKMQRINLSNYWVIPKRLPQLSRPKVLIAAVMIALITAGCRTAEQGATLERLVGVLTANQLVAIFSMAVILGLGLRYLIRSPSRQLQIPQLDVYQMAYLAGGSSRAVELALTQLVYRGYLRPNVRNRTFAIAKLLPPEAPSLEHQVVQQVHQTPEFKNLRQPNKYDMHILQSQLEQERLLMAGWAALIGRSFGLFFLVTVLVLIVGIIAAIPNTMTVLWLVIGIITLCCIAPAGRTRWGSQILSDLQKNHDRYDTAQRFALYGHQGLSGGALDDLKQIVKAQEDEESGSGGCGC
uniref:TIGR04222 domain-containing membrane protein n=1 Tax=Oscillatoriales cyanobacterium SpSt-402 TaxID=2282168 RepID=A0A832M3K2_9CYAN